MAFHMWPPSEQTTAGLVTVVVAVVIVTLGTVGAASGQSADAYGVRQGGECLPITPLSGDETVKQFYGYHTTVENDSSATGVGPSFSSEGTFDLQRAETSLLFLYEAPVGSLSLVMIHGARHEGDDGGAASFNITGLPVDGEWAVKDDDYESPNNTDRWRHGGTNAEIDWAWSKSATDGAAFAGLGDEFEVTVAPAFNGEAELFGVDNWGVVDDWQLLSGNRSNPERVSLEMEENVTISSAPCDAGSGTIETETETETETGTETETATADDDDADDRDERTEREENTDAPNREDDPRGDGVGDDDHPIFGDDDDENRFSGDDHPIFGDDDDEHPIFDDDERDDRGDDDDEGVDEEDEDEEDEDEEDDDDEDEEDDD